MVLSKNMTRCQMRKRGETDDEGESAVPDWKVRAGPRSKPTQREREEHEATQRAIS